MAASPWVQACIDGAYERLQQMGVSREDADIYAMDTECSTPGSYAWIVPNLKPQSARVDRWGIFLAAAKAYAAVEGAGGLWAEALGREFEQGYAVTFGAEENFSSRQRANAKKRRKPRTKIDAAEFQREFEKYCTRNGGNSRGAAASLAAHFHCSEKTSGTWIKKLKLAG